jgi:hypothetical protein
MSGIQEWIYHWGEGAGARLVKFVLLLLAAVALAVVYDLRAYKCWSNPEAMEAAQVARNLAEGKGYVTQCIRPFSLHLLQKQVNARVDEAMRTLPADRQTWTAEQRARMEALIRPGQLAETMPDITTPPVYPVVLSVFMKVAPFKYDLKGADNFLRFQPELLIGILNQLLFFLAVWMVYCLARKLFDDGVAWMTALVLMGTELFWRVSLSGMSTMLLCVLFLGVVWCLVWLASGAEEFASTAKLASLAALCGLLLGLGALTRYSFICLVLPVVAYIGIFLGGRRVMLSLLVVLFMAAVVGPWMYRNYSLSGSYFGTAGYAVHEGSAVFPGTVLPRSLNPDFTHVNAFDIPSKLVKGLRGMVVNDLPKLGGSWLSAFFLVGLLVPFKSPVISRLRIFLCLAVGLFTAVQALGETPFNAEAGETSSENLLLILAPLVFMYGVALFFTVLDQARAAVWEARPLFVGGLVAMAIAPLVLTLLPPRLHTSAYPPYSPPIIQSVSHWMQPDELMVSDIPWAVAWYGHRTCVWLPLNSQADFAALNQQRRVMAVYLTPQTIDNRFLTQWVQGENQGWGRFVTDCLLHHEAPTGFPLVKVYANLFPEQLFLTDRERWNDPAHP